MKANQDEDATTFSYFEILERTGETKDICKIFCQIFDEFKETLLKNYNSAKNYPLWNCLQDEAIIRDKKNCDDIFAEYLRQVANYTNSEYFATVMKFVVLYRECINKYGWIKFKAQEKTLEYSIENDAEYIPELANELVLSYLSEYDCTFPVMERINLTINFCEWLILNGYTCIKIIKDY